jgi:hypothetical protein
MSRTSPSSLAGLRPWRTAVIFALTLIPIAITIGFVLNHRTSNLVGDDWCGVGEVVVHALDGNLTLAHLFEQHNTHRPFTLYGLTALSYVMTGWNREVDIFLSVGLMLLNFALIVELVRRAARGWLGAALVVGAALLFSLRLRDVYLWSGLWSYILAWTPFLAALWVLRRLPTGWPALLVAVAMVITATFTLVVGWLGWLVLPWVMWMSGYRRRAYFGVWFGAMILIALAYFGGYQTNSAQISTFCDGISASEQASWGLVSRLTNGSLLILAHLASPFIPGETYTHLLVAPFSALLVVFVLLNAAHWVRRRRGGIAQIAPLVGILVYGFGAASMTMVGRMWDFATFNSGYQLHITFFWAVFIIIALGTALELLNQPRRRALAYFNLLMTAGLAVSLVNANIQAADYTRYPPGIQPYTHLGQPHEDCLAALPFARTDCLTALPLPISVSPDVALDYTRRYAEARLLVFGEPTAMLPDSYTPGTPVIIAAAPAQQHPILGYQDGIGQIVRIPERDIYHIAAAREIDTLRPYAIDQAHLMGWAEGSALTLPSGVLGFWLLAMEDEVGTAALAALGSRAAPVTGDWWRRQFDVVARVGV